MRFVQRSLLILTIAATLSAMLLGGGVVVLAGDHEDCRDAKGDCKGKIHIVVVDEDGEHHEDIFEFDPGVPRAFLGVHLEGAEEDGVVVRNVVEDSAAERAGLEIGDVIVGIDGDEVEGPFDLTKRILGSEPGDSVDLEIMRDGRRRTLTAELGEHEGFDVGAFEMKMEDLNERLENLDIYIEGLDEQLEDLSLHVDEDIDIEGLRRKIIAIGSHRPMLGVQLVEATPELREHMGADAEAGVLVGKVLPDMPAEEAGVEVGDLIVGVDGENIEDAGDLISALRKKGGETIRVDVIRDGRALSLDVSLPEREEKDVWIQKPRT